MKINLLICYFLFVTATAQEDPFIDVFEGKTGVRAFWEKLLIDGNKYDGKLILIDGFLSVFKVRENKFKYYLFMDSESLKYSRPGRAIYVDSERIESFLSKVPGTDDNEKIKMNGKYVKILSVYQKPKNHESEGRFLGPILVYFIGPELSIK
jgi:hypothetical protein